MLISTMQWIANGMIGSSTNARSRVEEELGLNTEQKKFQKLMGEQNVKALILLRKPATFNHAQVRTS